MQLQLCCSSSSSRLLGCRISSTGVWLHKQQGSRQELLQAQQHKARHMCAAATKQQQLLLFQQVPALLQSSCRYNSTCCPDRVVAVAAAVRLLLVNEVVHSNQRVRLWQLQSAAA